MEYNLCKKNKCIILLLLCIMLSLQSFAQQVAIRGEVQNSDGDPLIEANVLIKQKNIGTYGYRFSVS